MQRLKGLAAPPTRREVKRATRKALASRDYFQSSDRVQDMLVLRENGGLTYREIGKIYNLSRQRIQQLFSRAGLDVERGVSPDERSRYLDAYQHATSIRDWATRAGVSVTGVTNKYKLIGVTREAAAAHFAANYEAERKRELLDRLRHMTKELGHSPTSTEIMNSGPSYGLNLATLLRYFGGVHEARNAAGIPHPPNARIRIG